MREYGFSQSFIVQYSHYTGELGEFPCILNKYSTVVRNGSRNAARWNAL